MLPPLFVRPLTDAEHAELTQGLRSGDAFTLRRSQLLLASARGEQARAISEQLGCSDQTVRNAITAFNQDGLAALDAPADAPRRVQRRERRAVAGVTAPQPARVRVPDQRLDLGRARRGQCGRRTHSGPGQWRDSPRDPEATRRALAAGQAVDHQPRPRVCPKKGAATAWSAGSRPTRPGSSISRTRPGGVA